jgi:hypothetical protein
LYPVNHRSWSPRASLSAPSYVPAGFVNDSIAFDLWERASESVRLSESGLPGRDLMSDVTDVTRSHLIWAHDPIQRGVITVCNHYPVSGNHESNHR